MHQKVCDVFMITLYGRVEIVFLAGDLGHTRCSPVRRYIIIKIEPPVYHHVLRTRDWIYIGRERRYYNLTMILRSLNCITLRTFYNIDISVTRRRRRKRGGYYHRIIYRHITVLKRRVVIFRPLQTRSVVNEKPSKIVIIVVEV